MRLFDQDWCPDKLQLSAISNGRSAASRDESLPRDATLEIYVASLKRKPIAMSSPRLSQFISTDFLAIYD